MKQLTAAQADKARAKFEELKKLVEQRQQVQVELISKVGKALEKVKVGSADVADGKAGVAKRPSLPAGLPPDPKRPRTEDLDKRINEIWSKCKGIVKGLRSKGNVNMIFGKPVDPIKDKVPDYFKFVTTPMDLGTVANKLQDKAYKDPREFAADMRLIWANCATYNQVGTIVRSLGDQFSDEWERKWMESGVEAAWDEIIVQKDPLNVSLDKKLAVSARQLVSRVNSIQGIPAADPTREMTTVEKRKLSIALTELQGDQLAEVLHIIAESLHNVTPDDEQEIELDIDALDNVTLWRLRTYCDTVRNKLAQRSGAPGLGSAGGGNRPPARTESGSESDRYSAEQDVKGSNMVEQPQSQPNFVKNQRSAAPVDESVTAPKDKPAIATDKKTNKDVVLNASAWTTDTAMEDAAGTGNGGADTNGDGDQEDALWDSFRSVAEKDKQQKAEEEKRRKELEQERERQREAAVAEARRVKEEEERKIKEAEDAAAEEAKRATEQARQRELEQLQKEANTAQVYRPPDATTMAQFDTSGADMNELGLAYRQDEGNDDEGFDD